MVRFSAVCMDVADSATAAMVGSFWAAALGGTSEIRDDGGSVVRIDGELPMWIDPVPEPKVIKNRFHLDLHAPSVADLVALGASMLAERETFVVCADPVGNEFCVFPAADATTAPPGPDVPATVMALCIDSDRPVQTAAWWQGRIGGELVAGPDGTLRYIEGARGLGAKTLKFVPVDDERIVKNRWHWDVETTTIDELVEAGATIERARDDEIGWTVLHDPDGNVFCAFEPDHWVTD